RGQCERRPISCRIVPPSKNILAHSRLAPFLRWITVPRMAPRWLPHNLMLANFQVTRHWGQKEARARGKNRASKRRDREAARANEDTLTVTVYRTLKNISA